MVPARDRRSWEAQLTLRNAIVVTFVLSLPCLSPCNGAASGSETRAPAFRPLTTSNLSLLYRVAQGMPPMAAPRSPAGGAPPPRMPETGPAPQAPATSALEDAMAPIRMPPAPMPPPPPPPR